MFYQQTRPEGILATYIDAYWVASSTQSKTTEEKILPDGCVDIILNAGSDCRVESENFVMKQNKMYLVGAMTKYKVTLMHRTNHLFGIRFKPGAFSLFCHNYQLHGLTDQTVELDDTWLHGIKKLKFSAKDLNHFFNTKLDNNLPPVLNIVRDIQQQRGNARITELAEKHYHTTRQIERLFKKHVGISPKELSNITRYREALNIIQQGSNLSLQDIANICGYYDHSHLSKDIKRYTGNHPSQL